MYDLWAELRLTPLARDTAAPKGKRRYIVDRLQAKNVGSYQRRAPEAHVMHQFFNLK